MGRAANGDVPGGGIGWQATCPGRPAQAAQVRADLEYRAAHREPGPDGAWAVSLAVLHRVRDALAPGGRP